MKSNKHRKNKRVSVSPLPERPRTKSERAQDSKTRLLELTNRCMHILRWAFSYVITNHKREINEYVNAWDSLVNKWITTRGLDNTVDRIKLVKLYITRHLCGQPILERLDPSIAVDQHGIPKNLGILRNLAKSGEDEDIRLLLSLLSIGRALPGKANEPNLLAITELPPVASLVYCETLKKDIPFVMSKYLNIHPLQTKLEWEDFHLSTKAGPNWLSMTGSLIDVLLLSPVAVHWLTIVGGNKLLDVISCLRRFNMPGVIKFLTGKGFKPKLWKAKLRKLSLVYAPDRKCRIIGIIDYWSQTALKPLHDRIFKILKSIPNDFTFNQLGVKTHFRSGPYYSLDLRSATDRFPIALQKHVVAYLTSEEYAESWYNLMVTEEFYVPWMDTTVKYGAGQPMGAYSSWAVFTLTHHFILAYCKFLANKPDSQYAILGDDIVINDHDVARIYKQVINNLGVDISETKSHYSCDVFEFAKRWYRNGKEISGLQLNAFVSSDKWYLIAHEVRLLYQRWGLVLNLPNACDVLLPLLRPLFCSWTSHRLKRLCRKCQLFLMLPQACDSKREYTDKVELLVGELVPHLANNFFLQNKAPEFFRLAMAEIKSRIISSGVQKTMIKTEHAVRDAQKIISSYGGVPTRKVILSIPFVNVLYNQVTLLRNYLQDLRDPMVSKPQEFCVNFDLTIIGFNPDRVYTKRKSEQILAANATLVNQFKIWAMSYNNFRDDVLNNKYIDENEERAKARSLFKTSTLGAVMPGFPL